MNFVLSYSCGKDSILALHRMTAAGHKPSGLLVMINEELGRSWFHGVDLELLRALSQALAIPLIECPCSGEAYHTVMEEGLRQAKRQGAKSCVFGDIDVQDNAQWCRQRCEQAGIDPVFPLWKNQREEVVREMIGLGYRAVIKCIRSDLPQSLLGTVLTLQTLDILRSYGADLCGENGEYHTLVVDGPLFQHAVPLIKGEILTFGSTCAVDLRLCKKGAAQ